MAKSKQAAKQKTAAKEETKQEAVANERLVDMLKRYDASKEQVKTYLVEMAEIVQEEQLSRPEIVASMMEARGISKATAESQFSRMKKILTDPDTLKDLKEGKIDLATARARTAKKQEKPSAKRQAENDEKKFTRALNMIVEYAKSQGEALSTILLSVKTTLKKAGVR